jgi:hypothetical protein
MVGESREAKLTISRKRKINCHSPFSRKSVSNPKSNKRKNKKGMCSTLNGKKVEDTTRIMDRHMEVYLPNGTNDPEKNVRHGVGIITVTAFGNGTDQRMGGQWFGWNE